MLFHQEIVGNLREGDRVKIIDSKKSENIYSIMEIKNSIDGKPVYLLKSDSNDTKIVYYESEISHLEKID